MANEVVKDPNDGGNSLTRGESAHRPPSIPGGATAIFALLVIPPLVASTIGCNGRTTSGSNSGAPDPVQELVKNGHTGNLTIFPDNSQSRLSSSMSDSAIVAALAARSLGTLSASEVDSILSSEIGEQVIAPSVVIGKPFEVREAYAHLIDMLVKDPELKAGIRRAANSFDQDQMAVLSTFSALSASTRAQVIDVRVGQMVDIAASILRRDDPQVSGQLTESGFVQGDAFSHMRLLARWSNPEVQGQYLNVQSASVQKALQQFYALPEKEAMLVAFSLEAAANQSASPITQRDRENNSKALQSFINVELPSLRAMGLSASR